MYMDNIKLRKMKKKNGDSNTDSKDIQLGYRGEFGIEECAMFLIKSGKRQITEGIELPNQERIRMSGEKETFKYLGILQADTIKQIKMKEKFKKSISEEQESFFKPSTAAGICSKI